MQYRTVLPCLILFAATGAPAFASICLRVTNAAPHRSWTLIPMADGPKGSIRERGIQDTEFLTAQPFQPLQGQPVVIPAQRTVELEWDDAAVAEGQVRFAVVDEHGRNPHNVQLLPSSQALAGPGSGPVHLNSECGPGTAGSAEIGRIFQLEQTACTIRQDAYEPAEEKAGAPAAAGLERSPVASRAAAPGLPGAGDSGTKRSVLGKRQREDDQPMDEPAAQRPRLAAPVSGAGREPEAAHLPATGIQSGSGAQAGEVRKAAPKSLAIRNRTGGLWLWTMDQLDTKIAIQHVDQEGNTTLPDPLLPGKDVELVVGEGVTTLTPVDPAADLSLGFELHGRKGSQDAHRTFRFRWTPGAAESLRVWWTGPRRPDHVRMGQGRIELWSEVDLARFTMTRLAPLDSLEPGVPAKP